MALTFLEAGVVGLSIGFRIEFFSFLPAIGFGVAAMAMIGQNIGGGRPDRARKSYYTALTFAFCIGLAVGLGAVLGRIPIVDVFTDDPVVTGYTRSYLAMIPFTYGIVAALFVVVSSFQGTGQVMARVRRVGYAHGDPGRRHPAGHARGRFRWIDHRRVVDDRGCQPDRVRIRLPPAQADLPHGAEFAGARLGRRARRAAGCAW